MERYQVSRYYCSMCDDSFPAKIDLLRHQTKHANLTPAQYVCESCNWPFDDSVDLERHHLATGHGVLPFPCDNCSQKFLTSYALDAHHKTCAGSEVIHCKKCRNTFSTDAEFKKHRRFPSGCSDDVKKSGKVKAGVKAGVKTGGLRGPALHQPTVVQQQATPTVQQQATPTVQQQATPTVQQQATHTVQQQPTPAQQQPTPVQHEHVQSVGRSQASSNVVGKLYCHACKGSFKSEAVFDRHFLWCTTQRETPDADTFKPTQHQAVPTSSESVPATDKTLASGQHPKQAQPLAQSSLASQPATAMDSALHHAPTAPKQPTPSLQSRPNGFMHGQSRFSPSVAPRTEAPSRGPPALRTTTYADVGVSNDGTFHCDHRGCKKKFKSAQALSAHQRAVQHGTNGSYPSLHNRQAGILTRQARKNFQKQGLLQTSLALPEVASGSQPASLAVPPAPTGPQALRVAKASTVVARVPAVASTSTAIQTAMGATTSVPAAIGQNIGGQADFDQADEIHGKIVPLRIQSDINIQHDGKMLCGGIAWTRIGVAKHPSIVAMFDENTHLPRKLQASNYLPSPKTFKDEYQTNHYAPDDSENSPDRRADKPGLNVVALSCSKVLVQNGCQEVVKIAAVDAQSCRILMNFLVWTSTDLQIKDWRPRLTGLSNIDDVEAARLAGYKVLKGWKAAREALWTFIDNETIIIGHNLRADFDALRMIHGRAVDIAKCVEKAADGPLSKAQLSLDSISRDFPGVMLETDATFGRDCLVDAFAVREFGLWMLKQGEEMVKKAKAKSREYQRLNPN